jgi:hypothetical protein
LASFVQGGEGELVIHPATKRFSDGIRDHPLSAAGLAEGVSNTAQE